MSTWYILWMPDGRACVLMRRVLPAEQNVLPRVRADEHGRDQFVPPGPSQSWELAEMVVRSCCPEFGEVWWVRQAVADRITEASPNVVEWSSHSIYLIAATAALDRAREAQAKPKGPNGKQEG